MKRLQGKLQWCKLVCLSLTQVDGVIGKLACQVASDQGYVQSQHNVHCFLRFLD